jgi:CRP-like cAMP-binding protein
MDAQYYAVLWEHVNRYKKISYEDFENCKKLFHVEYFKQHNLVVKAGDLVTKQYFIAKGCLRTYMPDDERDREYTVQFAVEEWWASDYIAYYTNSPATLDVECLEDCILLSIQKKDLESLYLQVDGLESFFLRKLENAFVAFQKRILSNLKETAEQRYEEFVRQYPTIEQRVKNFQIASYLGITPESLSRIRKARQ